MSFFLIFFTWIKQIIGHDIVAAASKVKISSSFYLLERQSNNIDSFGVKAVSEPSALLCCVTL